MDSQHWREEHDWPPSERPYSFIQWKGTEVCMDFQCECGESSHYDGFNAGFILCSGCGRLFEMSVVVAARLVPPDHADYVEHCQFAQSAVE